MATRLHQPTASETVGHAFLLRARSNATPWGLDRLWGVASAQMRSLFQSNRTTRYETATGRTSHSTSDSPSVSTSTTAPFASRLTSVSV